MVCIYFSNHVEADSFYKSMVKSRNRWWVKERSEGYEVILKEYDCNEVLIRSDLICGLYKLLRGRKWLGWIEGILRNYYYYEDSEEIQRLLEIGQEFEDKLPGGLSLPAVATYMKAAIKDFIADRSDIVFDDLAVYCLQSTHTHLIDFTGIVIDEYKQEESYQLLVDSWRYRVRYRDTGVRRLHLIMKENLLYFHEEGNRLRESEISLYRALYPDDSIANIPLEWGVTPALVHAPDELIIYADNKGDESIELLLNIFEEKALFKPLHQFPFKIS